MQTLSTSILKDKTLYLTKKSKSIIIDFGLSLPMEHVKNTNLYDYFYVYAPEYYVWPLEVHYINFLLHVSENPTEDDLKDMVKHTSVKMQHLMDFQKNSKRIFINYVLMN